MTLSITFSWMKILEFRLNFHWSLFQLTIFQHWFRRWLVAWTAPVMVSLLTHICANRPQWVKWITKHGNYIWDISEHVDYILTMFGYCTSQMICFILATYQQSWFHRSQTWSEIWSPVVHVVQYNRYQTFVDAWRHQVPKTSETENMFENCTLKFTRRKWQLRCCSGHDNVLYWPTARIQQKYICYGGKFCSELTYNGTTTYSSVRRVEIVDCSNARENRVSSWCQLCPDWWHHMFSEAFSILV